MTRSLPLINEEIFYLEKCMARHVDHAHLKAGLIVKGTHKLLGFAAVKVAASATIFLSIAVINN